MWLHSFHGSFKGLQLACMLLGCRRGELSSAYNTMKSALAASRACRIVASSPLQSHKPRGKKARSPGSPAQPHSHVAQPLQEEKKEHVGGPTAANGQHRDPDDFAQSLEVSSKEGSFVFPLFPPFSAKCEFVATIMKQQVSEQSRPRSRNDF